MHSRLVPLLLVVVGSPFLMGAGCGGRTTEPSEVPDVGGTWALTFQNDLSVEVDIGGTVSNPTLAGGGDSVTVQHAGKPVSYTVDCAKELVKCPSELLPASVLLTQPRTNPRSLSVEISESECRNGQVTEGTCTGTLVTKTSTRTGSIAADGKSFTVVLGGGAAADKNCMLLTLSLAQGNLVTSGSAAEGTLKAEEITGGKLTVAYGGACLVVGQADLDPAVESAATAASVKLTSSFTATRGR